MLHDFVLTICIAIAMDDCDDDPEGGIGRLSHPRTMTPVFANAVSMHDSAVTMKAHLLPFVSSIVSSTC